MGFFPHLGGILLHCAQHFFQFVANIRSATLGLDANVLRPLGSDGRVEQIVAYFFQLDLHPDDATIVASIANAPSSDFSISAVAMAALLCTEIVSVILLIGGVARN